MAIEVRETKATSRNNRRQQDSAPAPDALMMQDSQEAVDAGGGRLLPSSDASSVPGADSADAGDPFVQAQALANRARSLNPTPSASPKPKSPVVTRVVGNGFGPEADDKNAGADGQKAKDANASVTPAFLGSSASGTPSAPNSGAQPLFGQNDPTSVLLASIEKLSTVVTDLGTRLDGFEARLLQSASSGAHVQTKEEYLEEVARHAVVDLQIAEAKPTISGFWLGQKFFDAEEKLKKAVRQVSQELAGEAQSDALEVRYQAGFAFIDDTNIVYDNVGAVVGARKASKTDFEYYKLRLHKQHTQAALQSGSGREKTGTSAPSSPAPTPAPAGQKN